MSVTPAIVSFKMLLGGMLSGRMALLTGPVQLLQTP